MEPFFSETYSSEEADFMSHLFDNNTNATMPFLLQENSYTDGSFASSWENRKGISVIPFLSEAEPSAEYNNLSTNCRKQSCSFTDANTSWKRPKFSKSQKLVSRVNIDGVDHDATYTQITNIHDSNNESKEVAMLNINGKKRASSGSSIDSQSVYAKKRRERINERLRILQTLVPNGTKVDISTMLEEAVEYVKFLQIQIKVLSSDDLWMYAPIAYNGMDLGLNLNLPSPT